MADASFNHFVGNLGGGTYSIDADLDNIHVKELPRIEFGGFNSTLRVQELPRIDFGDFDSTIRVKELPRIDFGDFNTNIRIKELPRIEIDANTNSTLDVAITKFPNVRAHLPANYHLGISIFGIEFVNFSLCGESQIITEENVKRRMEICD